MVSQKNKPQLAFIALIVFMVMLGVSSWVVSPTVPGVIGGVSLLLMAFFLIRDNPKR